MLLLLLVFLWNWFLLSGGFKSSGLHINVQCYNNTVAGVEWSTNDTRLDDISISWHCDNSSNDGSKSFSETFIKGQINFGFTYPLREDEVCNITILLHYDDNGFYKNLKREFQCSFIDAKNSTQSSAFLLTSTTLVDIVSVTSVNPSFYSSSTSPTHQQISSTTPVRPSLSTVLAVSSSMITPSTAAAVGSNSASLIVAISVISVLIAMILIATILIASFILLLRFKRLKISHSIQLGPEVQFPYFDVYMLDDVSLTGSVMTIEQPLTFNTKISNTYSELDSNHNSVSTEGNETKENKRKDLNLQAEMIEKGGKIPGLNDPVNMKLFGSAAKAGSNSYSNNNNDSNMGTVSTTTDCGKTFGDILTTV